MNDTDVWDMNMVPDEVVLTDMERYIVKGVLELFVTMEATKDE